MALERIIGSLVIATGISLFAHACSCDGTTKRAPEQTIDLRNPNVPYGSATPTPTATPLPTYAESLDGGYDGGFMGECTTPDGGAECKTGDQLISYFGYSPPRENEPTRNVGICRDLIALCNTCSVYETIQDEQLPQDEICGDGLDNDCNGFTDEDRMAAYCGCGSWGRIIEKCIDAQYVPQNCQEPVCCPGDTRESGVCTENGIPGVLIDICDQGIYRRDRCDPRPECTPGDRRLVTQLRCIGDNNEIGNPVEECIDSRYQEVCCHYEFCPELPLADIVFVLDTSGSIEQEVASIRTGLVDLIEGLQTNPAIQGVYQFGILEIPSLLQNGYVGLRTNLTTDYTSFLESLSTFTYSDLLGEEPSYDAIYGVADPSNLLNLNFRLGAKRYVVLATDEAGQSYRFPPLGNHTTDPPFTEEDVRTIVQSNGVTLYAFVPTDLGRGPNPQLSFDTIIRDNNGAERYGRIFDLPRGVQPEEITDPLNQLFNQVRQCVEACPLR